MRIIEAMRYLGIDYGLKRIGIAVSDEDGRMAFPAGTIINRGGSSTVCKDIAKKVKGEKVGCIIVGLPMGLDSKETEQTKITQGFIALLKKTISIPVKTENEILTSRMAVGSGMKGVHIDATSAAIILQSYLDKSNR